MLQFCFSLPCTGPKILLYIFLSKMFNFSPSVVVSILVSDAYVDVLSIIVLFSLNFSFFDIFNSLGSSVFRNLSNYSFHVSGFSLVFIASSPFLFLIMLNVC